jgi:hypothetical protein
MFCNRCQIEFESWNDRWGKEQPYCPACYQLTWDAPKKLAGKDHYCILCGEILPKVARKHRGGHVSLTSGHVKYCAKCKPTPPEKKKRTCIICGVQLLDKAHKYCTNHKPGYYKVNPITNRRTSIEWQKNNPQKVRASQLARYYPDMVSILYECRCENGKKHRHHYDYKKPFDVILLCDQCHMTEHKRLRSLAEQSVAI